MRIGEYIDKVLIAFGDPHRNRVEIPFDGKNFRDRFYKAMRRRGQYWKLTIEGDKLHVRRYTGRD
jgi:hypothetical protein